MNQTGDSCSEGAPDHEQSACAGRHRSAKREIANGAAELIPRLMSGAGYFSQKQRINSTPAVHTLPMIKNKFFLCGLLGWCMEILFTGFSSLKSHEHRLIAHTSIWMFPIYGMASLFAPVSRRLRNKSVLHRGCIYMLMIFAGEFITGSILRRHNACPWDYSSSPYHICGLIRLDYAPWWFAAGLIFEKFIQFTEFTKDNC